MDQKTPAGDSSTKPPILARVALNVLALCFTLSVLGRGLGESFTVFLKPISENFGWDRAQVVSVYSLTWLAGGLVAPFVGRLFDRSGPRVGLFARAAPARQRVPGRLACARTLAVPVEHWAVRRDRHRHDRQRSEFDPARPLVRPAAADRDGRGLFRDRRRRTGAVAAVANPDRPCRLARRLPDCSASSRCACWCAAVAAAMAAVRARARRMWSARPTRTSSTTAGRCCSAMRHHAFWALFSTFFFTAIGMYAIAAQIVAYLIDAGFPPLQAATAWGFSGVVLLFGMLGVTWLDTHHRPPAVGAVQLRDLDRRHHPALAVAVVSELLAARPASSSASAA